MTILATVGLLVIVGGASATAASSGGGAGEQARAATAAAPDALAKAREAMQKARQALNKARKALNKNRQTRQTAAQALATANQAQGTAEQALQDLNQALQTAQAAQRSADDAAQAAATATQDAAAALTAANAANDRLDDLVVSSDEVAAIDSTTEEVDYVSLGGPTVEVTVPPSGLIEVWASVRFEDPSDGLVALYEDGQRVVVEGQEGLCGSGSIDDALLTASFGPGAAITLSTPPSFALAGCGTIGDAPGPVMFERSPGPHTYELRYADCGCDPGAASFSNRTLRVAPRP